MAELMDMSYHQAYEHCRVWLADFTYKPGWQFGERELYDPRYFGFWMTMLQPDTDSPSPAREIRVGTDGGIELDLFRHALDPRFEFYRHLVDAIHNFEAHETLEWAKVGGVKIFNPHPNGPEGASVSRGGPSNYQLAAFHG